MINFTKNKFIKWFLYFCLSCAFLAINLILIFVTLYSLQKSSQYIESSLAFILIILIIGLLIWLLGELKLKKNKLGRVKKIILYILITFSLYWILALFFSYTCVMCNDGQFPWIIKWAEQLYYFGWFKL